MVSLFIEEAAFELILKKQMGICQLENGWSREEGGCSRQKEYKTSPSKEMEYSSGRRGLGTGAEGLRADSPPPTSCK